MCGVPPHAGEAHGYNTHARSLSTAILSQAIEPHPSAMGECGSCYIYICRFDWCVGWAAQHVEVAEFCSLCGDGLGAGGMPLHQLSPLRRRCRRQEDGERDQRHHAVMTMTLKQDYIPWTVHVAGELVDFQPLAAGLYFNTAHP